MFQILYSPLYSPFYPKMSTTVSRFALCLIIMSTFLTLSSWAFDRMYYLNCKSDCMIFYRSPLRRKDCTDQCLQVAYTMRSPYPMKIEERLPGPPRDRLGQIGRVGSHASDMSTQTDDSYFDF